MGEHSPNNNKYSAFIEMDDYVKNQSETLTALSVSKKCIFIMLISYCQM